MDSLHTGSDELVYIQTDKVSVTIKGPAAHPNFQGVEYQEGNSSLKVFCDDDFELSLKGQAAVGVLAVNNSVHSGIYAVPPLFFEQQRYEIIIDAADGCHVSFWHDNLNIRNKVSCIGRRDNMLSGMISFGNEIGLSDFVIQVNGVNYLRLVVEVFPTKISYREDYQAIVADVTEEIYNIVFDFLKKTYLGYQQSDHIGNSPVEFFAIIRKIFSDFLKAADMILSTPHHVLETHREVLPGHKIKRVDAKSIRWIEKHPDHACHTPRGIAVDKALAIKKHVTYNTKENQLTKYILQSTEKKLDSFRHSYQRLQRAEDKAILTQIDDMIKALRRRSSASFLADVQAHEGSSGLSLVFPMAPGYRDLYKYYLMLLHGLSITGDVFQISIKDLALLYEYWCFIKLNSLMKERYELISQDIIQVHGNGLYVSLVKGTGSRVKYRNPTTGETITLSYNPKEANVPTVTQRPDNVLTLEKRGANVKYEYVFDAKYRINPALPGTDYYNTISHRPGPEVSDINAMHRYRDAIVYQHGAAAFERTMFGAYVLFPYNNEAEYKHHKFYESIGKVNIGGLPFLPSALELVSSMLDELVSDSPDSAFERATLPVGIDEKLAKVDWTRRDVLVGSLSGTQQLAICKANNFYHTPARHVKESSLPIHTIAIYQSKKLFGANAGIRYYGEVVRCIPVKRREIKEIPKDSDELYYRFEVKEWKELARPIAIKEAGIIKPEYTNRFLLEHSTQFPELKLRSEEEFRLYMELKRALNSTEINDEDKDIGFRFNDSLIIFEGGNICVYQDKKCRLKYTASEFGRRPNAVFRSIQAGIQSLQSVTIEG